MQLASLYHVNDAFREVRDVAHFSLLDNCSYKATGDLLVFSTSRNTAGSLMGAANQKTWEFRHWMDRVIDTSADYISHQQVRINFYTPKTDTFYAKLNHAKLESSLFY